VVVVLLVVAVVIRLPTLDLPLLERHEFRQTQTAYTARVYHREGIDLLQPQVPVLGPPWVVPFEFPLFQAGAALVMDAGVGETVALRGFSLMWFIVSAVLLYALLRPRIGTVGAIAALVVFLFSPFEIVWSRTSTIESMATAATLGFAVAALTWRERGGRWWWGLALALGSIAMLVKITTAVFWIVPFAVLGFGRDADARGAMRSVAAWALALVPLAVGLAWTRYADGIKAASEATASLTSAALAPFTFGTLGDRFDPAVWIAALAPSVVLTTMFLLPVMALIAYRVAWRDGQLRFVTWLTVAYAAPIVVLLHLYELHDYYSVAVAPAAAAIVGVGVAGLAGSRHVLARPALLVAAAVFVAGVALHAGYALPIYGRPPIWVGLLRLSDQIAAETRPDQLVAIMGRDWNPALLYHADRRGRMVRWEAWPPGAVERYLAEGWAVYHCPIRGPEAGRCIRITAPPG
jgi:4-amino-4-deoxy-L-arabinose transferase-like glycosyltransferase